MNDRRESPGGRRGSTFSVHRAWTAFASGFGGVVFLSCASLLAGRLYEIALTVGLAVLAIFEVWVFLAKQRSSPRGNFGPFVLWVTGATLGLIVVWFLFFMPDF